MRVLRNQILFVSSARQPMPLSGRVVRVVSDVEGQSSCHARALWSLCTTGVGRGRAIGIAVYCSWMIFKHQACDILKSEQANILTFWKASKPTLYWASQLTADTSANGRMVGSLLGARSTMQLSDSRPALDIHLDPISRNKLNNYFRRAWQPEIWNWKLSIWKCFARIWIWEI